MTQPARLTSDLLARKGQAYPSGGFAGPTIDVSQPLPAPEKLGPPRRSMALVTGALECAVAKPVRLAKGAGRGSSHGDDGRIALTLRLDRERHRRLRIFGARHERTSQEVILKALDVYLAACGSDCACLRGEWESCARV